MKNYVIRAISWAYNDQTYEYDGAQRIVQVFPDYESAHAERMKMERQSLLLDFGGIYRFEVGDDSYQEQMERRERINRFLYERLGFNPTIMVGYSSYYFSMFSTKPDDDVLDELVDVIGAHQYTVVEYPDGNSFEVYSAQLIESICGSADYGKFHFDNSNLERFFLSRSEAFDFMVESSELMYAKAYFNRRDYFKKPFAELSLFPEMLKDLVDASPWLEYKEDRLHVDYHIDKDTLRKLFNLMKEDPIILTKRSLTDDDMQKVNVDSRAKRIEKDWRGIDARNEVYGSLEKYLKSPDRLLSFLVRMSLWPAESNYDGHSEMMKLFLLASFGQKDVQFKGWQTIIRGKRFQFEFVMSEYEDENHKAKVHLKTNYDKYFDLDQFGIGEGMDVKSSFTEGLVNWLDRNGDRFNERILKIIELDQPPIGHWD